MTTQTEATQYIKATLTAFGPGEAISMTKETWTKLHEAMTALVAQPAQKPVAWCVLEPWLSGKFDPQDCFSDVELDANVGWVPLYTSPQKPAQPWVGLTDAEIDECEGLANIRYRKHTASVRGQHLSPADGFLWHCAKAIEAKLKEKNT